eukprot:g24107.t1
MARGSWGWCDGTLEDIKESASGTGHGLWEHLRHHSERLSWAPSNELSRDFEQRFPPQRQAEDAQGEVVTALVQQFETMRTVVGPWGAWCPETCPCSAQLQERQCHRPRILAPTEKWMESTLSSQGLPRKIFVPCHVGGGAKNRPRIQITSTEERSSMLKSWSVYLLEVDDFGRKFTLEKRFDDFNQLHSDLREVEPGMPPLPEKKFMASTDASVVAERKPAFERILRYLLRSEVAVHEKAQTLFKFLELPPAAVVAFRYLFKTQRVAFARQCGKLTDPKWEKDDGLRRAE